MGNPGATAMQPIFPVPGPDRGRRQATPLQEFRSPCRGFAREARHPDAGFTLVEAMVALVIATVLTATTAAALIGSLRAEQAAGFSIESEFAAETLATQMYLKVEAVDLGVAWSIETTEQEVETETTRTIWSICKIHPNDRPSMQSVVVARISGPTRE